MDLSAVIDLEEANLEISNLFSEHSNFSDHIAQPLVYETSPFSYEDTLSHQELIDAGRNCADEIEDPSEVDKFWDYTVSSAPKQAAFLRGLVDSQASQFNSSELQAFRRTGQSSQILAQIRDSSRKITRGDLKTGITPSFFSFCNEIKILSTKADEECLALKIQFTEISSPENPLINMATGPEAVLAAIANVSEIAAPEPEKTGDDLANLISGLSDIPLDDDAQAQIKQQASANEEDVTSQITDSDDETRSLDGLLRNEIADQMLTQLETQAQKGAVSRDLQREAYKLIENPKAPKEPKTLKKKTHPPQKQTTDQEERGKLDDLTFWETIFDQQIYSEAIDIGVGIDSTALMLMALNKTLSEKNNRILAALSSIQEDLAHINLRVNALEKAVEKENEKPNPMVHAYNSIARDLSIATSLMSQVVASSPRTEQKKAPILKETPQVSFEKTVPDLPNKPTNPSLKPGVTISEKERRLINIRDPSSLSSKEKYDRVIALKKCKICPEDIAPKPAQKVAFSCKDKGVKPLEFTCPDKKRLEDYAIPAKSLSSAETSSARSSPMGCADDPDLLEYGIKTSDWTTLPKISQNRQLFFPVFKTCRKSIESMGNSQAVQTWALVAKFMNEKLGTKEYSNVIGPSGKKMVQTLLCFFESL